MAQVGLLRNLGLGWDESIYASQTDPRRPALVFSAPRARGTSLIAAPLQALTGSTPALRVYLAILAGIGLYVAYAVWLRLRPDASVPLAALLLASLWLSVFYGPSLMPNFTVALAGVFATGTFLCAARGVASRSLEWAGGAAVAVATLVRPGDVPPLVFALGLAALAHRAWRRRAVALVAPAVVGTVAGALPWLVEAQLRYGGIVARIHRALATQGTGERFVPDYQLRAIDGPLLCRPCHRATQPIPLLGVLEWGVGLVLVAAAVVLAVRRVRGSRLRGGNSNRAADATLLPAFVGVAGAIPYLFLVGYAAPRFLLPAYALLALPAAQAIADGVAALEGRWRVVGAAAVAVLIAAHIGVQATWLERIIHTEQSSRDRWAVVARALTNHGIRPPCVLTGTNSPPIAYLARCDNAAIGRPGDEQLTTADLMARLRSEPAAIVLRPGEKVPSYARGWTAVPRKELPRTWRVLISPLPRSLTQS